jgi:ubiquitin carboxyl-terminal hydrolase L3
MGLKTDLFSFQDVLSTEEWALAMISRPVLAVIMLFPIKESTEQYRILENIEKKDQFLSSGIYFMKQTVGNACGTVGILHAIANGRPTCEIRSDSYLDKFYTRTAQMSPDEIAQYLESDEEIEETHGAAATEGQSEQLDGDVDTHFVCFRSQIMNNQKQWLCR